MFIIGMPTLLKIERLEVHVKLCKRLGPQFIELNLNCVKQPSPANAGAPRRLATQDASQGEPYCL